MWLNPDFHEMVADSYHYLIITVFMKVIGVFVQTVWGRMVRELANILNRLMIGQKGSNNRLQQTDRWPARH